MAAGVYNIICEQGSSFRLDLSYTNNDGTPIHLGGFKVVMDVRRARTANSRLITQLSTDNGRIQVPAPETGEILLAMGFEDTRDLIEGEFFYDLLVTMDRRVEDGSIIKEIHRVIEGNFVVRPGVTIS